MYLEGLVQMAKKKNGKKGRERAENSASDSILLSTNWNGEAAGMLWNAEGGDRIATPIFSGFPAFSRKRLGWKGDSKKEDFSAAQYGRSLPQTFPVAIWMLFFSRIRN